MPAETAFEDFTTLRSADLLILALVEDRARHGYEIGRLIGEKSQGVLSYNTH